MYLKYKQKLIIGVTLLVVACLIVSSVFVYFEFFGKEEILEDETVEFEIDDRISPLADQAIFLEVKRIRKKGIEDEMRKIGRAWKEKPGYHFVAILDTDGVWTSHNINTWDTEYVGWESFKDVEDEQKKCDIEFKIVETRGKLFSTSEEEIEGFHMTYDFKTGRWTGDDYFNDSDGYGHYNGENYEVWFDVHQTDYDGDGIPYWTEVNLLHTDPKADDSKLDPDGDGIPTAWEWKWGYDPFVYDNHSNLDPDNDGLSNVVEYTLEKWLANPFQQEIYMEVDFMEKGPGLFAHEHVFWDESQQIVMDRFNAHGITVHIDDGCMGGGGEYLRYIEEYIDQASGIASEFYKYHFADDRKGVFRYVFIHHSGGWCHPVDCKLRYDVASIPSNYKFYRTVFFPSAITPRLKRLAMAVSVMHEMGHSLGLMPSYCQGIDNLSQVMRNDLPLLQKLKARKEAIKYWDNYESCMNYAKFFKYVTDYSDGTHGDRDSDDWSYIDITYFQRPSPDSMEGIGE